jgi:FkbM family methyltransferase
MELHSNTSNEMTRWLVSSGTLNKPFVLVDVGVQDGISPRWHALGDHLKVYGFDLLEEAIAPLVADARKNRHYFAMGLADTDGELEIVIPANRYETQLYASGAGERRRVQVRRLDTLFSQGLIERADFIKADCEGFEPVILRGASNYFAASNLVGADIESNFNLSPIIPDTHFVECCNPLVRQRLMVFDLEFNRVPILNLPEFAGHCVHRPATLNVLFARNLKQERDSPGSYVHRQAEQPVDSQTILKAAIVLEAYGLLEWAASLLNDFAGEIGAVVDVDKALAKLGKIGTAPAKPAVPVRQRNSWRNWRVVAPLRATKRYLLRRR